MTAGALAVADLARPSRILLPMVPAPR